jgi:hypothetical protein
MVIRDNHPAIISREQFQLVQSILPKGRSEKRKEIRICLPIFCSVLIVVQECITRSEIMEITITYVGGIKSGASTYVVVTLSGRMV